MKFQVIYLPKHQGSKVDEPFFNTKKEAWKWIEDRSRKCPINQDGHICESCCAEWTVDSNKKL